MSQPQIAGLQHIVTGFIRADDTITFQDGADRKALPAGEELVGLSVELSNLMGLKVYRKIAVPKQGGLDHMTPEPVTQPCTLLQLVEQDTPIPPRSVNVKSHFIPQDAKRRKDAPMYRGLFGYFPAALFEVAAHSMENDRRHNPGSTSGPAWARDKSSDHLDCVLRHAAETPPIGDPERIAVLRAVAWRALAALQEECEFLGARPGVSSRFPCRQA